MKKALALTLAMIIVSACLPLQAAPTAAPSVDLQATVDTIVRSSVAQTVAALPSPTEIPATSTVEPSPTTVINNATETPTVSPEPNLTTTPVTATSGTPLTPVATGTGVSTNEASGEPSLTPTLGVLTYGTLPPAVPYADITLINKSEAQAYISLQNDPPSQVTILEYPVRNVVKIKAPLGYYDYVAWVGGRKMTGHFTLGKGEELTITLYKDRVSIQ